MKWQYCLDEVQSSEDSNSTKTFNKKFNSFVFNGYFFSLGVVTQPGREFDHSLHSSTEIKNEWNYSCTSHICLHDMHGDSLPFTQLVKRWPCRPVFGWWSVWTICARTSANPTESFHDGTSSLPRQLLSESFPIRHSPVTIPPKVCGDTVRHWQSMNRLTKLKSNGGQRERKHCNFWLKVWKKGITLETYKYKDNIKINLN
jgi:hypothetical protein